nr:DUF4395 domain-containing protein [uncultured Carboxylicivirga sp.]
MSKTFQFGQQVEGYTIPVLNEREIRASAGMLFLFAFISIMTAIMKHEMFLLKYFIIGFLVEFGIRLFINPRFAPTLILGRMIVSNQVPEYVGAKQKKFAWIIGMTLAVTMFVLIVLLNSYSIITGLICLICLIFLFFESVFGICLGCVFYKWIYKEKAQYCPGEVCEIKDRHEIQKTPFSHLLIIVAFIAFFVASAYLFNDTFKEQPRDLWEILGEKFGK